LRKTRRIQIDYLDHSHGNGRRANLTMIDSNGGGPVVVGGTGDELLPHAVSRAAHSAESCDPATDGTGGETVVDHIRLFPRRPDVRWTYRVHEQILPSLRRAKIPVRWTDVTVRNTGYVDKALRAKKLDRDTRILKREFEERPGDPFVCFNLGSIAIERQDWQEALRFLERSLAGSAPCDSIVRKLYALIARAHQMMGNFQEAIQLRLNGLSP
jgi:hypothetical protein